MEAEQSIGRQLAAIAAGVGLLIVLFVVAGPGIAVIGLTAVVMTLTIASASLGSEAGSPELDDRSAMTAILGSSLVPQPAHAAAVRHAGAAPQDGGQQVCESGGVDPAMSSQTVPTTRSLSSMALRSRVGPVYRRLSLEASGLTYLIGTIVAGVMALLFFRDLGDNPAGLFCDEAEIGLRSRELLGRFIDDLRPPIFYQHFMYTHMGALPLYASAPFVLLLGTTDFAVRLASVVWALVAFALLILFVRRMRWHFGEIGVLAFALSPVSVHFARINFGQTPSLCAVAAAFYCYGRSLDDPRLRWPALAGIGLAVSVYGAGAYYVAAPLIVASLALAEVAVNRFDWRAYRRLAVTAGTAAVCWLPVLYRAFTDDQFLARFRDKTGEQDPLLSAARVRTVLEKYGVYFDFDYLFVKGEADMPGSFLTRHSVPGAGELPWIALPLIVLGVVATVTTRQRGERLFGVAAMAMLALYPLPDALSSRPTDPPYTVSTFSMMLCVPVLAALGAQWLVRQVGRSPSAATFSRMVAAAALLALVVVPAVRFFSGPYADYPNVSAGYYGWQYGPRQAVDAFRTHRGDYDRYLLDGDFNEAFVFLDYYLFGDEDLRSRSLIGGFEQALITNRELLAMRAERFNAVMESDSAYRRYVRVVDVIRYPNGQIAMYILDFGAHNDTREAPIPR